MKQVSVMLPFDEPYHNKLCAIAGEDYQFQFWDSQWEHGDYLWPLEQANVILGNRI